MNCPNCNIPLDSVWRHDIHYRECRRCEFITGANNELVMETVWMFVSVDPNGNEGIITGQRMDGMMYPFLTAAPHMVEIFEPMARRVARNTGWTVKLLKFSNRQELKEFK
jgi:hypothetical protein